ncbi:MAG: hypothetical protein NTW65_11185 [Deltaproteobacteria bacterium]|nr:hypothetical protein [Deltaproteobacteria bacterium]
MKAFLRHIAEIGFPQGRFFAIVLAVVLCLWTAGAMALSPPVGTPIVNTATVQYRDANGTGDALGSSLSALSNTVSFPLSGAPLLRIEKTADSNPVAAGAVFTYTLRYENTGNASATGVTLIDTLPANVTFQSASAGGVYSAATRTVTWNIGTLISGTGGFLTVTVQAQADLIIGTSIINSASITSTGGMTGTANLTTTVGLGSNLVLEKSGAPSTVAPNSTINYNLSYRNIGNQTAHGVRVTDQMPSGTAYVAGSATAPGILNANVLIWDIGDVTAGSRGELTFQVRVSSLAVSGQQINNQASIISTEQAKASNMVVTTVSSQSLMLLKIDSPDPVRAGNKITYTLQIENTGTTPLTGIVLSDPLPVGTTFDSAGSGGVVVAGNRQVNWNIGNLAVGQKQTVTLTVLVDKNLSQGQIIENIATATSNEMATQTVRAVSGVNARTPGQIEFFNAAWQPVVGYMHGDTIYIQVIDLDQNVNPTVAETVTIVLTDLITGDTENVILTETGPGTGIFRGSIPSTLSATGNNSGAQTVVANSRIQATYTDSLDDSPVSTALALIDPLGIVFDSITGNQVSGAVVTLRNWNGVTNTCDLTSWPTLPPGQVNPAVATGADGKFAFPLVPAGDYCFDVTPPAGYVFPSVVSNTDLPAGFNIGNGSRGDKFTLSIGDPALIRDIPVDPPIGRLTVTKTANKTTAAIGDMIGYSLKITNAGEAPVSNITLTDVMPHGVQYISGSSRLNGSPIADPQLTSHRTFAWSFASLAPGVALEITYRAVVGPDAQRGDGINTVFALGLSLGRTIASNTASFKIKITAGIFTEKGTIIGKIFLDRDGNRIQNQGDRDKAGKPDEPGIANVVLYLEDGTRVITDSSGKYSILGILPGTHVLRVDETSLPKGLFLVPLSNRFLGDGDSQFVDMTPGGLFKADFAVERRGQEPVKEELRKEEKTTTATLRTTKLFFAPSAEDAADDVLSSAPQEVSPESEGTVEQTAALPMSSGLANGKETSVFGEGGSDSFSGQPETASTIEAQEKSSSDTQKAFNESAEATSPRQSVKTVSSKWQEDIKTMTPELAFLSPTDATTTLRKQIRVVLKAPFGTEPFLSVNGKPVAANQIGSKIEYKKGQVVIYEYIDIHLNMGEENILKAEIKDQFGISRGAKQITVTTAGAPERIDIKMDKAEIPADGTSRIKVQVSLRDKKGMIVSDVGFATVSVSAGEIVEKDADPRMEEHQIALSEGNGVFTIQAPRETGEAEITVSVNDRHETTKIFFSPHLRDLFMVGIGEIKIGYGQTKGDYGYLKDQTWFDDGLYKNGRGAFFMKGKFFKDVLITAAYDSDKKKRDDLFRENDTTFDTEDKYPIYGDESKTGYEALSADKLYLKVEKNRSYLLYGDYRTDLNDARLAAYNRSFNGLKYELNTPRFKIRAFGSYTDQTQVMDALPGKGISGYYYLTKRPVMEGSERVVIEVRDRYRTDIVLSRESKSRGSDYEIDYDQGALLFKGPIPSHDGDYNPFYIVVSYESKSNGEQYYVYGGRGAFKIIDPLEIGVTGVIEEKALGNYQLFGTDMTLNLPKKTVVKAEYAETRAIFEESSLFNWQSDRGWSVGVESEPLDKLKLKGYYRTLGNYFMNMSAADVSRGSTKYGFDAIYTLRPDTQIHGQFFDEKDDLNNMYHRLASIGAQTKYNKTKFSAELSNESSNANYIPPTSTTTRSPFDVSQDIPRELTAAKIGMETELRDDLSFMLSHKHNLAGDNFHTTQAGLNYQLNKLNRLYLREEYQQYQDRSETRTLFGAESQVIKNTVAFNEYRLSNAADGARNQSVIGLRNKFFLGKAITGNATAEYLRTISGAQRQGEPDAVALSLGLEYLAPKNTKIISRFEHRRELMDSGRDSYLGELGVAYKLNPDYSLLASERFFTEEGGTTGRHTTSRTMMGLAYRPLLSNQFNALTKMEYKHETNSGASPALQEDAYIFSGEGIWQATSKLQLTGKYAGKLSSDEDFSAYTDLISARFIYDLTDRWDVGAEYRLLTSHAVNTCYQGGSVEVGYRIIKNLWASVGYSFDKFDADLTGDGYQGNGPYLKLRFKFDETILRSMK